jgi:hypothetical protein
MRKPLGEISADYTDYTDFGQVSGYTEELKTPWSVLDVLRSRSCTDGLFLIAGNIQYLSRILSNLRDTWSENKDHLHPTNRTSNGRLLMLSMPVSQKREREVSGRAIPAGLLIISAAVAESHIRCPNSRRLPSQS